MHETNLRILATKEDISLLREDLANVKGGLMENIARVEGRLETKIAEVKSDVIRWIFAFVVAVMLAIIGLYFKR